MTIPNSVTSIGNSAFDECYSLTNVVIPNSVTSMGDNVFNNCGLKSVTIGNSITNLGNDAFRLCTKLTSVTIPYSVTNIGGEAFFCCSKLTSVTIGNSVTSIGPFAFYNCYSLTSVTIGNSVTYIGGFAFYNCDSLTNIYFRGNAPGAGFDTMIFDGNAQATMYYLSGTTGWHSPFDGRPAVLWNPQAQTSGASFGVKTNRFGFNLTGSSGLVIVVEASTNLLNWVPVATNTLAGSTAFFSDPQWTNYPGRFYRLRSP